MSAGFIFTPEASAEVLAIWELVANDKSERAADRVIARISFLIRGRRLG
jgi:plasmid stabilization system protein ParE